ncbi:MAG: beta-galactosidase trimerization domain-containing protein, partial [Planctomycetaceae bacterium]|nr:beta-galactosidase trimerization domain-containing protein [Planctomycetaceae bacterium]
YVGPVQVPHFSREFCAAHPDWLRVNDDGQVDAAPNFANIRSGYADWLLAQLAYVTKTYGVDGFWFDGYAPVHLHTYDDATRKQFREFSGGHEIPPRGKLDPVKDPVSRQYLAWHEQHFVDFADRMRGAIRAEKPDSAIFVNNSANRTWYYPEMYMGEYPTAYGRAVDVSSVELYWDVPGDALYQQFCCAFVQGVMRDGAASVWIQPSAHGISGVASPVDIQLRGLEGAPWGVYPEFVESTGREEYLQLHVENVRARDAYWTNSEPVPYIGIVASEQTRTLYAQGALPLYFSHTLGAFRAIFEKHWPVRVLTEYDLEDDDLRGVRVLVLPNVACLSDRAAEVIRRFVKRGGGLVATFETSLYDENFARRADFALADVLAASYRQSHLVTQRVENLYVALAGPHPIVDDPLIVAKQSTSWTNPAGPPSGPGKLALIASAAEVAPREGARTIATYQTNIPPSPDQHPAIVVSEFGAGRVVYLPAAFDKAMFFYPDSYIRQVLANACRWAAGDDAPPVEVEGPLLLATTFRRQPAEKRTIVHLLNDHSSYGRHSIYQKLAPLPAELETKWGFPNQSELRGTWPVREEVIPLRNIHVTIRDTSVKQATLVPGDIDLPLLRAADGAWRVTVPEVALHAMVVFA